MDDITPNGNCTLREAIQAANTDAAVDLCPAGSGTDVIDLTPGTYALTIPGPESGNTVSDLNVLDDLRINGNGATIDANALPSDRVIFIDGVSVEIVALTLTGGGTVGTPVFRGGGIQSRPGSILTLNDVTVTGNTASNGGGVFVGRTVADFTDVTIADNTASNGDAGGFFQGLGSVTIRDSLIRNNTSTSNGGGIHVEAGGTLEIFDSRIDNNSAFAGGGISQVQGTLTIRDSVVDNNSSTASVGGGIFVALAALDIENSTISNNDAGFDGGGISAQPGSSATIAASTITGNTAVRDGGGISSRGPNTLTITDSTIARNTAGRAGGGIGTTPSTSIITITGSTINDNVGSSIGGIWLNGGSLNVSNSTVSGNQASAGSNLPAGLGTVRGSATLDSVTIANNVHSVASGGGLRIESGTITNTLLNNNSPADCVIAFTPPPSGGNNLDSDGSCSLAGTGDISNGNANLGPLQNNGGPTETHALLTGSDAIDMGSTSLATDQRGVLRPVGLDSDIGAFESGVDIELVALQLRSVDPIDVDTAFDVFFDVTVENNAGVDPVDADVSVSLTAPPDCVVTAPGPQVATISGLNVPLDLTFAFGVICDQTSFHDFTGTASVFPVDPDLVELNLDNNDEGPVTITRPVIREVDGGVLSSVTRLFFGETSISVNEPVLGSIRSETANLRLSPDDPSDGVVFRITFDITAPPDCTVNGGATSTEFSFVLLAVDDSRFISAIPELQCSTPGFHTFTFESTLAPRDLHVIDINPLNDQGSGDLIVAVDAVDIELVALELRSIDPIDVNTAFDVFFDVTVENNAGVDPVDAGVSVSLTAPPDCVVTAPGPQTVTLSGPNVPVDLTLAVGVICSQPSFHDFTGTASVAPVDPDLVDGNLNNNDGGPVTITRPVNANPSLDADGDNIIDDVDVNPADPSNDSFSDVSLAGSTSGTITTRGDQLLLIRDDLDPVKGIRIAANPFSGPTPAQFSVCSNSATFALDAGDAATVTCGSVSIEVLVGTVQVEFLADDGSTATAELNQGDTLTFEPTTITFTAPESNPNTVVVLIDGVELTIEPNETVLPFSTFNAKLKIKRSPRADHDSFRLKGSFNLGAGSDGIDILHEDVVLQIGTYSTLIQAGFFEFKDRGRHGKYKFRGVIDGVNLKVVIKPQGDESYKLEARGKGADLSGTENPVLVTLAVGEDKGSVSVTAKIRDKKRSGGDDDSGSDDDDSGSDDDDSSSDD